MCKNYESSKILYRGLSEKRRNVQSHSEVGALLNFMPFEEDKIHQKDSRHDLECLLFVVISVQWGKCLNICHPVEETALASVLCQNNNPRSRTSLCPSLKIHTFPILLFIWQNLAQRWKSTWKKDEMTRNKPGLGKSVSNESFISLGNPLPQVASSLVHVAPEWGQSPSARGICRL